MRHDDRDEERSRCGLCAKILRRYDSISVAQVGERCYRCFNKELAERLGVDFHNTSIAPIVVTDVDGVRHRFEIRSMLVPTGHAMYAREITKRDARGGYRFEIEEATVDAYGESEQATAFLTALEEYLALPFGATILDEAVVVEKIDLSGADELIAICRRRGKRQKVRLLDLELPVPRPKGAEWVAAYHRWSRRR
jgi:hypothetical protein